MERKQPRGIRNNNPLNIRHGCDWKGLRKEQTDKSFAQFESMAYGLRAALILLRNYISGWNGHRHPVNTIEAIINRWAPPSENATSKYVDFVCTNAGLHPKEKILFRERSKVVDLLRSMAFVESGVWLERSDIESAYDLLI